jgi:hypothetical protein
VELSHVVKISLGLCNIFTDIVGFRQIITTPAQYEATWNNYSELLDLWINTPLVCHRVCECYIHSTGKLELVGGVAASTACIRFY